MHNKYIKSINKNIKNTTHVFDTHTHVIAYAYV